MNKAISTYALKIIALAGFLAFFLASTAQTICVRVSTSLDDIEEAADGFQRSNSSDIELVNDVSEFGDQIIGLRFNGISIPQGAVIENATIQFTSDETDVSTVQLTISGEDVDNSPAFDLTAFDVSTRTRTTADVSWSPPAWSTVGAAGVDQRTPDLSSIVQEIVSRPGFSSGNSLAFFFAGTGERTAEAYDGSPNQAAELCITYSTCGTPGTACDDGQACTTNDRWDSNCECSGTPDVDSDNDGVCDAEDVCPGFGDTLIGTSCDDGDPLTVNDIWQSNCLCLGSGDEIVINEVFLSGFNGSEQGDHGFKIPDWVELYNPSGVSVNLAGWYLSDNQNNVTKWEIPSGSIPANGRRVFTLDGTGVGSLNTNFKIDQSELNEEVVLSSPSGEVVDIYKIRSMTAIGHSRGRLSDGGQEWGVFTSPTKNLPNAISGSDYCPLPEIDVPSGAHPGSISVTIDVPIGFTARYELNVGTNATARVLDPTAGSAVYTGALNFNQTTILKVRLFDDAGVLLPGFVETNTYLIGEDHSIYTLSVSGKNNIITLLDGSISLYPTAHWEFFDEGGELLSESAGNLNKHGQDSWAYPHRGFDLFSRDEAGYGGLMKHKFFEQRDRTEFDRFILRAAGDDNYPFEDGGAHIRDAFIQNWGGKSGLAMDHRSYRPCVVYINGRYWGVYEIREKVVHKSYTKYYYNQDEDDLDYISYWGGRTIRYGSPASWDNMMNFIQNNNMAVASNFAQVDDAIDLTSWTDYVLFNNYIVSKDWNNYNSAWWRGRNPEGTGQKWKFILWDMDASFGHYINYSGVPNTNFNASPCDVLDNSPISDPENLLSRFEKLIDQNPGFRDFVANRYNDMLNTYWSCDYALPILDEMIDEKLPEMPRQIERWGGNMTTWANHVQDIRDFMNARCGYIDNGLQSCLNLGTRHQLTLKIEPAAALAEIQTNSIVLPELPMTGNYYQDLPLELTAISGVTYQFSHWATQNGTVITDINDPNITLNVTGNDVITAHFVEQEVGELVINEIHYNPQDSALTDSTEISGAGFEFIELKNTGTTTLNIGGMGFSAGITYLFPVGTTIAPGDFVVLAGDEALFEAKYGFTPDGVFAGDLDNSGEFLRLGTALEVVDSLTYDDSGLWDGLADAGLYSLGLIDAGNDNSVGGNWSIQSVYTTPGEENVFGDLSGSPIVINEIHYNPTAGTPYEFIEIVNTSDQPYEMQGVAFTEGISYTFTQPFSIPPASAYPDNYVVLAEDFAVFQAVYGFAPYAQYTGRLSYS